MPDSIPEGITTEEAEAWAAMNAPGSTATRAEIAAEGLRLFEKRAANRQALIDAGLRTGLVKVEEN